MEEKLTSWAAYLQLGQVDAFSFSPCLETIAPKAAVGEAGEIPW